MPETAAQAKASKFQLVYNDRTIQQHVNVDKSLADRILLTCNTKNRPINRNNVNYFKNKLQKGEFKEVDAITISKSGRLMDGQHRLKAISETNIPAKMTLILGEEDTLEMYIAINTCKPQSPRDFVEQIKEDFPNIKHLNDMVKATRVILFQLKKGKVDLNDLYCYIVDNQTLYEEVSNSPRQKQKPDYIYNPGIMYAMEILLLKMESTSEKQRIMQFFHNLWNQEISSDTHPVEKAYAYWMKRQGKDAHTGVYGESLVMKALYNAWLAYKAKRNIKQLRVTTELPDLSCVAEA